MLEGTFKQSEFATDISQVAQGIATPEYQDAEKFYARTYITEGMRLLLISVAQCLAGKAGDPVIQLQTNFGGGKTHTLPAVYHLASRKVSTDKLPGIPSLLDEAGITNLPTARIAVIDGTNLSPNQPMERGALKIKTWKVFFSKSFLDTLFAKSFPRMYIAELPQRFYIIYSVRKIGKSDNI